MPKDINKQVTDATVNFKRGATEMLLLSLLLEKEQYAYELSKALKQRSQGLFDIQGPSLYTVMYRMEQKGFVATREQQVGRRIRVYYHLLPEGEVYRQRLIEEYRSVSKGISAVLGSTTPEGKQGGESNG